MASPLSFRHRLRQLGLQAAGALLRSRPRDKAVRSVLLLRPDHIGDVLLLTPALAALRERLPGARITIAVGSWSAEVVRNNPDVDEVVTIPFPGFERRPKRALLAPYRTLWVEASRLRGRGFDTALVMRFDHWWGAWLAALAGIPRRIGYDLPEMRPFLTEAMPYRPGRHETLQNVTLVDALAPGTGKPLGPVRFEATREDRDWATRWLSYQGVGPDERIVAIHPGAGAAVKQWPTEQWARVGRALQEQRGVRLMVTGGPAERELAAEVMAGLGPHAVDCAGQTSLGQLAALFGRCALVLGVDSGPLHLAVATGVPTVHLYGPVPAAKFGPWGDPRRNVVLESRWACAPCDRLDWPRAVLADHGCIATMPAQRVVDTALTILGG